MSTSLKMMLVYLLLLCGTAMARHIEPSSRDYGDFYDLCLNETVKCAAAWSYTGENGTCFDTQDCTKGVAVETADNGYVFHMFAFGENLTYMSLGFSNDTGMGADTVVACINTVDGVKGELSYNVGKKNIRASSDDGLTMLKATYFDEVIYCQFTLTNTLQYARDSNNGTESQYYIVATPGKMKDDGSLGMHTGVVVSDEKWAFGPVEVFPEFYDMCEKDTVKCAGAWRKSETEAGACFENRNCTNAIAMEKSEDGFTFYMFSTADKEYMALGFSNDTGMGNESVVACVKNDAEVVGTLSYNVGKTNIRADSDEGLIMHEAKFEDGNIYCKFSLKDTVTYAKKFNSDNEFYIVGASGSLESDGSLGHHSGHILSDEKWVLTSSATTVVSSVLLAATSCILAYKL